MTKAAKGIAAAVAIGCVINRVGRRSGATGAEVAARLPGDEIVRDPMWQSTRAITIDKPPGEVWPWIVQMGFPSHRAGWYTPYWLDKLMWGIHRPSAETIVPGLQRLGVGDIVPDSEDVSVFFTVADIERDRALVLHSTRHLLRPIRAIDFTWAFVLSGRFRRTDQADHASTGALRALVGMAGSRAVDRPRGLRERRADAQRGQAPRRTLGVRPRTSGAVTPARAQASLATGDQGRSA